MSEVPLYTPRLWSHSPSASLAVSLARVVQGRPERELFMDNLLVRIHFITVMIRWTGLEPRKFEFPFPGSCTSTFLGWSHSLPASLAVSLAGVVQGRPGFKDPRVPQCPQWLHVHERGLQHIGAHPWSPLTRGGPVQDPAESSQHELQASPRCQLRVGRGSHTGVPRPYESAPPTRNTIWP